MERAHSRVKAKPIPTEGGITTQNEARLGNKGTSVSTLRKETKTMTRDYSQVGEGMSWETSFLFAALGQPHQALEYSRSADLAAMAKTQFDEAKS